MKFLWINTALFFKLKNARCYAMSSKLMSSLVRALTWVPFSRRAKSYSVAWMNDCSSPSGIPFIYTQIYYSYSENLIIGKSNLI